MKLTLSNATSRDNAYFLPPLLLPGLPLLPEHRDLCESAIRADHQRALPALFTVFRFGIEIDRHLNHFFTSACLLITFKVCAKTALPIFYRKYPPPLSTPDCFPAPEQFSGHIRTENSNFSGLILITYPFTAPSVAPPDSPIMALRSGWR